MAISESIDSFAGRDVEPYNPETGIDSPATVAYRIGWDWDTEQPFEELLVALLADDNADKLEALVIGSWGEEMFDMDSSPVVQALVDAAPKLPKLRGIFFGDIVYEECEISWIQQSDVGPLLRAFPRLTHLTVRGGEGLRLSVAEHEELEELVLQAGGLDAEVQRQVAQSRFPSLRRLELWLGTEDYGYTEGADLSPIMSGKLFPRLTYLGLKNFERQDEISRQVASAPVVGKLHTLDLSMGTMSDDGARHLLASPSVGQLQVLDVSENFLSSGMVAELSGLPCKVVAHEQKSTDDDWRYVTVGE